MSMTPLKSVVYASILLTLQHLSPTVTGNNRLETFPRRLFLRENPPEVNPRGSDRVRSIQVSASFQLFALRLLLHSAGALSLGEFL